MIKPRTVTQVTEYISSSLSRDYNLRNLPVQGEISGFGKSGPHYYFTLKDTESRIDCAVWASNARKMDMSIFENGAMITAICDISPYAKTGSYKLSVKMAEPAGEGGIKAEFERIRKMLSEEGLFDQKYKKPIPAFPSLIGVITSDTGAAVEDIRRTITGKNNYTDILIFPTVVQGPDAPASIIQNVELANDYSRKIRKIDTLIVGRGGGSAEDLMAFNDEGVARAIFASEIPVISAVGHEIDFSISDFVADIRALTPTAAGDLAAPDTRELAQRIEIAERTLIGSVENAVSNGRRLLDARVNLMYSAINNRIAAARSEVEKACIILRENDPLNVLSKGYSVVLDIDGKIVSEIDNIDEDSQYTVRLKDGSFKASVVSKERSI